MATATKPASTHDRARLPDRDGWAVDGSLEGADR